MNATPPAAAGRPRSSLSLRFEALRRDAATVLGDLMGRSPAPFSTRKPLARHGTAPLRPAGDLLGQRSLVVERVVHETADAVSLHLADPTGAPIDFAPGQFFTLIVTLPNGQQARGAYSLSLAPRPGSATARITVKRIADGKVSGHVHAAVRDGDRLTFLGPSGQFGISAEDARGKHLLLIAGGSGITPLRSILEARLSDPSVTATLLYGNRGEADVIFREELESLAREHEGRFTVRHVLDAPPEGWKGGVGRLDRIVAKREIEAILASELANSRSAAAATLVQGSGATAHDGAPAARTTEVLVCGPTPMMEAVRAVLGDLGVPASRVREEQFSSPEQRTQAVATRSQPVTFRVRGKSEDTVAAAGQTLLEAGIAAGVKMPFSCAMGGCGACKVKLVSGDVASDEPNCLSAEEAKSGFVLTCVSRAAGPVTLEVP